MKAVPIATVLLSTLACTPQRVGFRVLPAEPSYLLRLPDSTDVPFPEVPASYTNVGQGWVDMRPDMELRVENAYYREGAPRRGMEGYIGTEVARYRADQKGSLRLISVESKIAHVPRDQLAVQKLLSRTQARYRNHRLYYQIGFKSRGNRRGAVLLSAGSGEELDRLGTRLSADPESVCSSQSVHCTVFPNTCTASLEMKIFVNGGRQTALWGSFVSSVAAHPHHLELLRPYKRRLRRVEIDPNDPSALRLPLLPGDHLIWN